MKSLPRPSYFAKRSVMHFFLARPTSFAAYGFSSQLFRGLLRPMLNIDLTGKRAFVAGVADDGGFGFAIAKQLAEAGASVCVGTWPPAYTIFTKLLQLGKIKASLQLQRGGELKFEHIYPFDAD